MAGTKLAGMLPEDFHWKRQTGSTNPTEWLCIGKTAVGYVSRKTYASVGMPLPIDICTLVTGSRPIAETPNKGRAGLNAGASAMSSDCGRRQLARISQ
jgi:hypothetical protein